MKPTDARSLPPAAQEALRLRVVRAVQDGLTQTAAATAFDVARGTVNQWVQRARREGVAALQAQRRGRPPAPQLPPRQTARVLRTIVGKCPDQLRLPFALWTREAVRDLVARQCGRRVSVWTIGRWLKRWGLTPQKPLRRAFEQDPAAVRRWLRTEYPAIRAQAKRERAAIHWGDEMGLRSDHQAGRSYGLRGQTPVVPGTGQRFGCNMISTVTNRGRLAFMVFRERFTARVFLRFLRRLRRHARGRPVFLIVDRHPTHRAAAVTRWVAAQRGRLRLFFLPAYSPELNPDELLNQDVKRNGVGVRRPHTPPDLLRNVRGYLRSTQRRPARVRNYFRETHVQYAAG
jgi:transposase